MGLFYENFERICRAKGTSPSAAVMAIGRSKNASANWKANGTLPKEDELNRLAAHLGCHVSDFFIPEPQTKRGRDYMTYYMLMLDSENEGIEEAVKSAVKANREGAVERPDSVVEFKQVQPAPLPEEQGPVEELDDYQSDFMALYDALAPKDRIRLMNMVYGFAEERGVEL